MKFKTLNDAFLNKNFMLEFLNKSQKTIWVINQFAGTPDSGWGERHFYFSKYWISAGYNVKIISGSFNHVFKKNIEVKGLYIHENHKGVDFYWVNTPKYKAESAWRFFSMLVFTLRIFLLPVKKIGKPAVVIVSSMPIFPILNGLFFKIIYGSTLIFEIRDIWPLTLQLLGKKAAWHPAILFIGFFEKLAYNKSNAVVSLLPNARNHIENIAKKKVSFHYIPNGIDPTQIGFEPIPDELDLLIPKDKFIVGYAGTLGLANALEYLVEASIRLKDDLDIFFVLVGDGYLKKELMNKVEGNHNILFFPKIKKAQIQKLIARFDIAFVGRNDNILFIHGVSANKYFDYMLAGKPILDSNNLIKDPVEISGCGVIVLPESKEAISNGIYILKNMSIQERYQMGQKGRDYVLRNHSIERLAAEYATLFDNFLTLNKRKIY